LFLTWAGLLWGGVAAAEPMHVRAVASPPETLQKLTGKRAIRLYWDAGWPESLGPATVELKTSSGWKAIGSGVEPGWLSKPLPRESQLRVIQGGQASAAVWATWGLDAQGVARLGWPELLPGAQVADIIADGDKGAWVALLEGGLVYADKTAFPVQAFGVFEGLPSPQVNALLLDGEQLWVATGDGLALVVEGRVTQVWDLSLSDPWVQALGGSSADLFIGTYHGLDRLQDRLTPLLSTHSVFSITVGRDGRFWAGYEGVYGLPEGEPIEGVNPDLNIWDSDHYAPDRVLLATDTVGVLQLKSGVLSQFWMSKSGATYALERQRGVLYVAADTQGLVALNGSQVEKRWTRAQGLPGDSVTEVAAGPSGRLWVGTDQGLALLRPKTDTIAAWRLAGGAAGIGVSQVSASKKGAWVATDLGLAHIGEVPGRYKDALAIPGPVLGVQEQHAGRSLWVLTPENAYRVRPSGLERLPLPARTERLAVSGGSTWLAGETGLYRHDGGLDRFVATSITGPVLDLSVAPSGLLWVLQDGYLSAVDAAGSRRDYLQASQGEGLRACGAGTFVWGNQGLELVNVSSGEVSVFPALAQIQVLDLVCEQGNTWVLTTQGLVAFPDGGLLYGVPELSTLGEIRGLDLDDEGRAWIMGEGGVALYPLR